MMSTEGKTEKHIKDIKIKIKNWDGASIVKKNIESQKHEILKKGLTSLNTEFNSKDKSQSKKEEKSEDGDGGFYFNHLVTNGVIERTLERLYEGLYKKLEKLNQIDEKLKNIEGQLGIGEQSRNLETGIISNSDIKLILGSGDINSEMLKELYSCKTEIDKLLNELKIKQTTTNVSSTVAH